MRPAQWPFKPGEYVTPDALDAYNAELERRIDEKLEQSLRYHSRVLRARAKERTSPRHTVDL